MGIITKLFGTRSSREVKKIQPLVERILALEPSYTAMTDQQLKEKTPELRQRLQNGETLDDLLPEAFAAVREAAWRVLGMKHFPVQLIGGIVLHQGRIAEMKTGEGKTLVATLPAYLNALTGNGVHIVTVNSYLAKRDSEWMGKVFRFLGMSVGLIVPGMDILERQKAYRADITYCTNNELAFDYLRDNMAMSLKTVVQREMAFAIVDEVDSILIDEARTPFIISGKLEDSTDMYQRVNEFVRKLKKKVIVEEEDTVSTSERIAAVLSRRERMSQAQAAAEAEQVDADYIVDEKGRTATLTPRGIEKAEQFFEVDNLSDLANQSLNNHINQALRAYGLMKKDVDYVVKDGNEIVIVDEFTGRLMFGRRYNEGLHQAIEAKEGVHIQSESQTVASITFQNYFRMYRKLSGMTGTALTEEEEFSTIYKLDVVEIPPNRPVIRIDHTDMVFKNEDGKIHAILDQVEECHKKNQPVLIGTITIEKSELLSRLLTARKIEHNVLNAKQHEREAEIVAQAGKFGAVTIATNMAGRGTDIVLGGNPEYMARNDLRKAEYTEEEISEATGYGEAKNERVAEARKLFAERLAEHKKDTDREAEKVRAAGGLFIIGTERHESRRIDNQLRGRSGRQGDPGESRFYLSFSDDLIRLYSGDRSEKIISKMGILPDDMPMEYGMVASMIEAAQKRMESGNFQSRKSVLEYDDVVRQQRELIYEQRRQVLRGEDVSEKVRKMISDTIRLNMDEVILADDRADLETDERDWKNDGEIKDYVKEPEKEKQTRTRDYIRDLDEYRAVLKPYIGLFMKEEDCSITLQELNGYTTELLTEKISERAFAFLDERVGVFAPVLQKMVEAMQKEFGPDKVIAVKTEPEEILRVIESRCLLHVVDDCWIDHIDAMSDLQRGIGLRGFGTSKPIDAFRNEGYEMFEAMVNHIKTEVTSEIFQAAKMEPEPFFVKFYNAVPVSRINQSSLQGGSGGYSKGPRNKQAAQRSKAARQGAVQRPDVQHSAVSAGVEKKEPYRKPAELKNISRNSPCPCGSGKKFKVCDCPEYHQR